MTPSARLQAVLDILREVAATPRPADALISSYFRARRYIGSKDRAAVADRVYAIFRHEGRLGWWLESQNLSPTPCLRLFAYLTLVEGATVASLAALTDGKPFSLKALTPTEREGVRRLEGRPLHPPEMPEVLAHECPPWAEPGLRRRWGADFSSHLAAFLNQASLDGRVNTLKMTREQALVSLKKVGESVEPCPFSPVGIRWLSERPALSNLALLREGALEIQDEGSQLIAALLGAKAGENVLDLCAGAGGKTLALAAAMHNKGRLTACDTSAKRLEQSILRLRRAGVHNVTLRPLEGARDSYLRRHRGSFDRVLLDAPCSGMGVWRRHPETRGRNLGPKLEDLMTTQAELLTLAAELLKPGGRLVYATCSLLPEEDEDPITRFLDTQVDFRLVPLREALPESIVLPASESPYLILTPRDHATDGFFAAALERATP